MILGTLVIWSLRIAALLLVLAVLLFLLLLFQVKL